MNVHIYARLHRSPNLGARIDTGSESWVLEWHAFGENFARSSNAAKPVAATGMGLGLVTNSHVATSPRRSPVRIIL